MGVARDMGKTDALSPAVQEDGTVDEGVLGRCEATMRNEESPPSPKVRRPRGRLPTADEGLDQLITKLENTTSGFAFVIDKPGDAIRRRELGTRLAVVLTTLRRALRRLESKGE